MDNVATSPETGSSPVSGAGTSQNKVNDAILTYPADMKSDQDRIMFHAHKYESGGITDNNRLDGINDKTGELNPVKYLPIGPQVFLPIQSSITDQNSVGWDPDTMNPIEVEAAKLSKKFMTTPLEGLGPEVGKFLGKAYQGLKGESESARTYLVGQAIGVNNLQSRLLGQVLNPNLELLFQGPQLRQFSFTFKLSPRSDKEAVRVKQIIKYFKQNMAVQKGTVIFLKAPNVFKIKYLKGVDAQHQSINKIKMCALTNCSVDYTPLGTYMTYEDEEATMVSYTLSLQFQELVPIYADDYDDKHPIGF